MCKRLGRVITLIDTRTRNLETFSRSSMVARRKRTRGDNHAVIMQRGYGNMPIFSAQPLQRGYGFGGLFRGFLKTIAPMAKRGLLSVGKAALNAGARALEDVRDNDTSVKQALKKQAIETFHPVNVINRTVNKRKASSQSTQPKRKVKRTTKATGGVKRKKAISDAPSLPR